MKVVNQLFCVILCAFAATVSASSVDNVGTYNLILKEDLNTASDIEGRAMIGGNIKNATEVGSRIPTDPVVDAVTVVGNINSDLKAENGNIVYGGVIDPAKTVIIQKSNASLIHEDQTLLENRFDAIYQSVIDDSAFYSSLAKNGEFEYVDNNKSLFNVGSDYDPEVDDFVVFNISGDDLNRSRGFEFAPGFTPSVPIIINVSGTDTLNLNTKAQGNFDKTNAAPNVLWNFYEYTELSFSDGWNGSILAPNAKLFNTTGSFDGGVAALSFEGNSEFHNKLFTYVPDDETPVPAPAPPMLTMLLASVWLVMRKRRTAV